MSVPLADPKLSSAAAALVSLRHNFSLVLNRAGVAAGADRIEGPAARRGVGDKGVAFSRGQEAEDGLQKWFPKRLLVVGKVVGG